MAIKRIKIKKGIKTDFIEQVRAEAYKRGQDDLLIDMYQNSGSPPAHIALYTNFTAEYVAKVIYDFEKPEREEYQRQMEESSNRLRGYLKMIKGDDPTEEVPPIFAGFVRAMEAKFSK